VTIKIETVRSADCTIINLTGELKGEYLSELRIQIKAAEKNVVLGMEEVTLVDLNAIRFLIDCQTRGVELRGSSAYIVEWIAREKEHWGQSRRPQGS
jgi:anti-anti-sigma regulatory factor